MSRKLSIGLVAVAAIFAGAVLGCREGALQGVEPIESPIPPPKLPTIGANVRDPNIYPLFSDQYAGGGQFDINMFFRVWPDGDSFSIADQRSTGAPLDELNCFRITIAENPNYTATWWGGGFEFKDGQERDMSDYTKLVIHIKVPILSGLTNMYFAIRNSTAGDGGEMIKVKLTDYTNVKNDGYWHKIEIPITKSLLTAKVKYPLAWGSLPGSENADWRRGDTFYLDRIYYTK